MLEEELTKVNKEALISRRRNLLVISAVFLLVLVLLSLASDIDLSLDDEKSMSVEIIQKRLEVEGSSEQHREEFIELLREYEGITEPRLKDVNWSLTKKGSPEELLKIKKLGVNAFSLSDYTKALNHMKEAESKALRILQTRDTEFNKAIEKAKRYFEQPLYINADLHIKKALSLKPNDAVAIELHKRIKRLPLVSELLDERKVAEVENNTQKEMEVIRKILAADPKRLGLIKQLKNLEEKEEQLNFSRYIDAGIKSVERGRLVEARLSYKHAKKISPNQEEVKILFGLINNLAKKLNLENGLKKSLLAINDENWKEVTLVTEQLLKTHPKNGVLLSRSRLAREVLVQIEILTGFITKHERLSSNKVHSKARRAVIGARAYLVNSGLLRSKESKLSELLVAYKKKVKVIIVSDDKTDISIKGLGKLGYTKHRELQIYPNRYKIEGKRQGFRSIIVEANIPAGTGSLEFNVVCDERI